MVKYFVADPYPYKNSNDDHAQKDAKFLQKFFRKTTDEIYFASKNYKNNSSGIRNFIFVVRSYENLRVNELSSGATTLAIAIIIFAIEGIVNHIKPGKWFKKVNKKNNRKRVQSARLDYYLTRCLNREQKLILLNSFVFSPTYSNSVPMKSGTRRHVMYKGMILKSRPQLYERHDSDWC